MQRFCGGQTACLQLSTSASAMLLERPRFADVAVKPLGDPTTTTSALAHGATPAKEPVDHGVMYGRSFFDLDGHHWEVMWMSPEAVAQAGPQVGEGQPVGASV